MNTHFPLVESLVKSAVSWLRLGVELTGALVIAVGIVVTLLVTARALLLKHDANFNAIRIQFARYLALALEFQLGADILSTAIAPGWEEISKLAAIAVIRTGLNYFLMKEMEQEKARADNAPLVEPKLADE